MKIVFDARMEAAERADWWRALCDALPADEWIDAGAGDAGAQAWSDADIAVMANPTPGTLAHYTRLRLIQSL